MSVTRDDQNSLPDENAGPPHAQRRAAGKRGSSTGGSLAMSDATDRPLIGCFAGQIGDLLIEGEEGLAAHQGMRDYVVFTNKWTIAVNVQGITGKKKDFTSLPFAKVQALSLEAAGPLTSTPNWNCGLPGWAR